MFNKNPVENKDYFLLDFEHLELYPKQQCIDNNFLFNYQNALRNIQNIMCYLYILCDFKYTFSL